MCLSCAVCGNVTCVIHVDPLQLFIRMAAARCTFLRKRALQRESGLLYILGHQADATTDAIDPIGKDRCDVALHLLRERFPSYYVRAAGVCCCACPCVDHICSATLDVDCVFTHRSASPQRCQTPGTCAPTCASSIHTSTSYRPCQASTLCQTPRERCRCSATDTWALGYPRVTSWSSRPTFTSHVPSSSSSTLRSR